MHRTRYVKLVSIIQDQKLSPLIEQAARIKKANENLKVFLPDPLSSHVSVCNIKGNILILKTNSPVWFTRTNFLATKIINYMRNEGGLAMVERLKVKVIPVDYAAEPPRRSIRRLSQSTSDLLSFTAQHEQDEDLANVLRKLARHTVKE